MSRLKAPHAQAFAFQPNHPLAVPSVAIVGSAKAGTTDLYDQLTEIKSIKVRGKLAGV